ncbi:MAG: hypothetical protein AAGF25_01805 [Pseudomonadota bacterium]
MWDFSISKTMGIMAKTMPFILLRMAVYFGITIAYIAATGAGAGIGFGVGQISEDPGSFTVWGGMIGFGIVSGIIYWLREYILYMVKAGHIAVMVKLIDQEPMPEGQSQVSYAQAEVKERFGQANVLFALDQIIKGIIKVITRLFGGVAFLLPIPGVSTNVGIFNSIVRMSLTYVDEIILGYSMRRGAVNPWVSSREGLVLYAQNGKRMIKNAVWLSVFVWIFSILIYIIMLAPAGALAFLMPGSVSGWGFVLAFVFAWAFKAAIMEPFAIAALMSVYFDAIEGQQPNPEWDAKLANASDKFRELAGKASDAVGGTAFQRS